MCSLGVYVMFAVVCAVQAFDQITDRAVDRLNYELRLDVACKSGEDTACVEKFFSVYRIYFYIGGAILALIIFISILVCCCRCNRRRSSRKSGDRKGRYSSPFEAVIVHPAESKSKQSLI